MSKTLVPWWNPQTEQMEEVWSDELTEEDLYDLGYEEDDDA